MDMRTGADAVSGATLVSGAAQEAVLNALNGRAGKTFLNVEGSAMPVASIEGNVVTLTSKLPKDFDLELLDIRWGVRNEEVVPVDAYTATVEDDKLILTFNDMTGMKAGYYYVNVVDASGKYRSPSFEGGPGAAQAPSFILSSGLTEKDLSFDGKGIVLAGGSLSDYLQNIEHVLIQAEGEEKITEQEIVGHHGTLSTFIALDENGILNADGVVKARNGDESPLFEAGKKYTVTVSAFGYPDLVFSYAKEDEAGTAAALIEAVKGTYTALFPVITDAQYDEIWLAPCVEALGSEMGPAAAEMLKGACNGTLYGPEAVEAYGDGSQGAAFDCLFIHGVSTITFDGTVISGKDEKGETVFSHEYAYAGKLSLGGMMDGLLYETADGDAGEFRYFFMMPDTPATTYHLEFRYGSNIEDLAKYNEGPYAYWLAAGFPVEADEKMIRKVITLFCEENLAGMQ
ncbi:MAG: hypothetical protein IJ088_13620 [Clostridia bacterium]|nr:hypothetical protein [Clostridia bacterium]